MKIQCPLEGYEDCFVDFNDSWTRAEVKGFSRSRDEEYLQLIRSKVREINLRTTNGVIDTAAKIDEDHLDTLEWQVFTWFSTLPQIVMKGVLDLGEAVRRQSLQSQETTQESDTPTP